MKSKLAWLLALYIAFVFIQSLFFKFSGSEETKIIFNTIGDWMANIDLLAPIATDFKKYGGISTGIAELIASLLILYPTTRYLGSLLSLFIISGAIFFHLATPLGINRIINTAGDTDGGTLFIMACGVFLSCIILLFIKTRKPRNLFDISKPIPFRMK